MKKPVQIVYAPPYVEGHYGTLYALCDDGSIWWCNAEQPNREWHQEEEIPQEVADAG